MQKDTKGYPPYLPHIHHKFLIKWLWIPFLLLLTAQIQLLGLTGFEKYNIVYEDLPIDNEVFDWGDEEEDEWDEEAQDDTDYHNQKNPVNNANSFLKHHLFNNCDVNSSSAYSNDQQSNDSLDAESQNHLDAEPSAIVNNSVNIITGLYIDGEKDFVIPGAEPIILQRNYVSCDTDERGPFGKSWNRNYFGIVERFKKEDDKKNHHRATVFETGGSLYYYGGKKRYNFGMLYDSYKNGVTNCGYGMMSARTNIKNNILEYMRDDKTCLFKKSSGEKMLYTPFKHRYFWRLTEEKKPNGNIIRYTYLKGGDLGELEACNSKGDPLSKITFHYSKTKREKYITIKCNDKEKASYRLKKMKGIKTKKGMYIVEALREKGPPISYEYENNHQKAKTPKIVMKRKPDGRFQVISYYHKGGNWVGSEHVSVKHHKSSRAGRVMQQCAPVGHDATSIRTHRYFYDEAKPKKPGNARVYDAYNHLTRYNWNDTQRLTAITHFTGTTNHKFYSREKLFWGSKCPEECTRLQSRCYETEEGIQFARTFTYDNYGNVTADELYGNLTGKNSEQCKMSPYGKVLSTQCEKHGKYFTYTDDGRQLMTSKTEGNVTQKFEYAEDNDLLTSKIYSSQGKIFKREFFTYDDNGTLILACEDDGNTSDRKNMEGVTERHLRYITPRKQTPIGLPEVVKEKYLDIATNCELLCKKMVYHYNEDGQLLAQDIYDANDQFLYTLTWEYDEQGNLIKETNPIGQIITKRYDANGNKIYEQGLNKNMHREFTYDYSDRLIRIDEIHNNGLKLCELYTYDYLGLKKSSTDIYGNVTHYEYDDFGRLTKTTSPQAREETGRTEATISKEYNCFNAPIRTSDGNGNVTLTETNIRGKPTTIQHPDGSLEEFIYNLDGSTYKHIHKNGSYTQYQYDFLKRVTDKSTYDPTGNLLERLMYTYNTFHLTSETDSEGIITTYNYDGAGRVIEMRKMETRTTYSYDAEGRLYKTTDYDGCGGGVSNVQVFDRLDRVLEERKEDLNGKWITKVSYSYDDKGDRVAVTNHFIDGHATTKTIYDNRHQPIETVDADGNRTFIEYRYNFINDMGQVVPYSRSTDALGNSTENIKDANDRLVEVRQYNSFSKLLHIKKIFYDANGNKSRQEDISTSAPGKEHRTAITKWSYDNMDRLISITEAVGTQNERYTGVLYNQYGEKAAIVKPDGVHLKCEYDLLGKLTRQTASDHSIDYSYSYDLKGRLKKVRDLITGTKTCRSYDAFGRLLRETLANGLKVEFQYDGANRPRVLTLPDGSSVEYCYEASQMKKIHRLSESGDILYTHQYDSYDLDDKLLRAQLIGNGGTVEYSYDKRGRALQVQHEACSETIIRYDGNDNITARQIQTATGVSEYQYEYDDLSQLVTEKEWTDTVNTYEHSYSYDSLNNRLTKDNQALEINDLNQLVSCGNTSYTYDLNGNLIRKAIKGANGHSLRITRFEYDALDRLIAVVAGNTRTRYSYDIHNRRISKHHDIRKGHKDPWNEVQRCHFIFVGQNEIGSTDANGKIEELRILGLSKGAEIGGTVAIELKGQVYAPLHDANGNITALIDPNRQEVVEYYRYLAFGAESIYDSKGKKIAQSAVGNPWRFSSKRVDNETGFVYFGRRYYSPDIGRWISPDPIGREGGPNLYAYVLNRPLTSYDCYGLFTMDDARFYGEKVAEYIAHAFELARSCVNYFGDTVNTLAFHLVPVPIVKDVLQLVGLTFAGNGYSEFHPTWLGKNVWGDLGRPEINDRVANVVTGGICTYRKDMEERALEMSNNLGGYNVHYYAASSDGIILDILKAGIRRFGIPLPGDQDYANMIRGINENMGGLQSDRVIHIKAHSQGAILTHNLKAQLNSALCKQLDVYTFGAGRLLNKDGYKDAVNFVSTRDPVPPCTNPFAYASAKIYPRTDIIFLQSDALPFCDHAMSGKVYTKASNRVDLDIKKSIFGEE